MPDPADLPPWTNDWIEIQGQCLSGFAGDYFGMAGDWWRHFPDLETFLTSSGDRYRQLFMLQFPSSPPEPPPGSGAALLRWQAATRRFGQQATAIAADASRRLTAALQDDDPTLPPITSLKSLYELWIDCGEAAYAAAAGGDEFAEAQAECLAAWVELHALQPRART